MLCQYYNYIPQRQFPHWWQLDQTHVLILTNCNGRNYMLFPVFNRLHLGQSICVQKDCNELSSHEVSNVSMNKWKLHNIQSVGKVNEKYYLRNWHDHCTPELLTAIVTSKRPQLIDMETVKKKNL